MMKPASSPRWICPLLNSALYSRYAKFLLLALLSWNVTLLPLRAQQRQLAPTPPMGWNSWDAYGTTVTEVEVRANADAMASSLKTHGWQYIVVDIQWYEPNAKAHGYRPGAALMMDKYGRLIPAANRFPSSVEGKGFKPLADYVHSRGLRFGIHILRGIPRQAVAQNAQILGTNVHAADIADKESVCKWNTDMYGVDMSKPEAQAYYDSLVALYAQWGVDLIKADDMSSPYHKMEIEALHHAIVKSGRPIVLSLSPGPAPLDQLEHLRANAEMWRIEDDLWDNWESLKNMYFRAEAWAPYLVPGHWPDADMLPLGHIGIRAERGDDRLSLLSHDEQKTMMTLWCMSHSPLMLGGDLPTLDAFTRTLITNDRVLAVNQHSGKSKVVYKEQNLRVWTSVWDKKVFVAVFNLSDSKASTHLAWNQMEINSTPLAILDLWSNRELSPLSSLDVALAPHASAFYEVKLQ